MPSNSQSGTEKLNFASQATTVSLSEHLRTDSLIPTALFLTDFPLLYLLPQGLAGDEYQETLTKLKSMHARLAKDINQARLLLSFANGPVRVKHDMVSERYKRASVLGKPTSNDVENRTRPLKRTETSDELKSHHLALPSIQQVSPHLDDVENDHDSIGSQSTVVEVSNDAPTTICLDPTVIVVLRLQWLYDSIVHEKLLPLTEYILLQGPWMSQSHTEAQDGPKRRKQDSFGKYAHNIQDKQSHLRTAPSQSQSRKRLLLSSQDTTEDLEAVDSRPIPEWVRQHIKYSCQRKQTQPTANEDFLTELRLIKRKRILDDKNEEKIRNSYGRAIASIAAYPYPLIHPSEVHKLPNCGEKFEMLFRDFRESGSLVEADEMRNDTRLQALDLFWNIHGIGPHMAKQLYEKGYRTMDGLRYRVWPQLIELFEDDPAELNRLNRLGDPGLDREQQQGLKFHDDFLERIPREEVEDIAAVIERHLKQLTDERAQVMLVGSYRKGKPTSGDVDVVVSHPDEFRTANLIDKIYDSLEAEGWIRAQLKMSLAHTHRDQTPVFKGHKNRAGTGGFAALDIALLVWQDISWLSKEKDLAEDPDARNPATCRRVDIIVSPWKSVGCAVLGWSGGITFERDIREYAHKELNWKFDSSGVMDRETGEMIDIERCDNPETRAKTIEEAERRVIEGLHLKCFDPKERLTD